MPNLMEIQDVSKIYGPLKALQDINLVIPPGQWTAVMGPSGSGKTTLMNIMGCLDTPSLGEVTLDGVKLSGLSPGGLTALRREAIGLIFQQFHLISYLTALENVMVAQYYHSMVDEGEALEALARVGLAERAKHLPRQLSGGEQQRVCIARALINHPKLILADEPTGNLDETNEGLVMEILHGLHNAGATIVTVTHAPEVARHAERVIVLEHGRLVSDEYQTHPSHRPAALSADGAPGEGGEAEPVGEPAGEAMTAAGRGGPPEGPAGADMAPAGQGGQEGAVVPEASA
ncbi:MAG: ATP-binding cassette domain-containing protein [Deltaproteobacteria bacterium]|jgi:putative ABC transport system ATP-binding protein|nr:ATP-binding cassette domain-containing protein [Deltaproteobacteria bacterium]